MKNNFFKFFLSILLVCNISIADQFVFETSKIEILEDGNLIIAEEGSAKSLDENLEINAEKFEYKKNQKIIKALNGIAYFKSNNLKIEFSEMISNQITQITTAKGEVKIFDLNKKLSIETNLINFNKKDNILDSPSPSIVKDKINNTLKSDSINYELNKGVIKLQNVDLNDIYNNNFKIDLAYLNTTSNELIGKDIIVNLDNKSFNKNNQPRIKGRSIEYNKDKTEITKGVFTTCKKNDSCPPWQLSAEKVQHYPKKQIINYENAFLKVYDIPVMYFPKFFHPDPTVKRKSGFLVPTIKNSPNSDSYLSLPYFSAISLNKDMTFTPRLYTDNKFLIQSEYRQENKTSSHVTDVSFFNEKNKSSKNHFFYKYNKLIDFNNFEDSNLDLKIEKTSNDTYLRGEKLLSPIIKNYNVLKNSLKLSLYSPKLSINSEVHVYENLDEENSHDRYEYILPKLDLVKKIDNRTRLDGNFLFKSNNFIKSYETNILEKININNFIFNSNPKVTENGFYNNYDFIIKNVNSDTDNSNNYKEDQNYYLSGVFQFNSSLPLIKEKNNNLHILKPKLALKVSPDFMKDLSKKDGNRLDVNNIFNIDRINENSTLESGTSLTLGSDFTINDKMKNIEIFQIKLANNIRMEENEDLPRSSQLGAKNSNFFGEISYNPNQILSTKYNASTKNNLTEINYENLNVSISLNNFVTTFDYLNENNSSETKSYLTNTTKLNFNDENSIKFSTRENKSSNLTEYYNLMYEYKNDCLAASIEYNKDYYSDRDIKPEENLFFKLTIIPFGQTSSPNLKN